MSAIRVVWVRFLGQIEAALPRKLVPFWKAPAVLGVSVIACYCQRPIFFVFAYVVSNFLIVEIGLGPQTIFFWAPAFKWGLVFAGIADLARPADKLSPSQSTALAATGMIWARYSMVIIPKNWLLFSVNIGLGITGINQLCRIAYYRHSQGKLKESSEQ